MASVSLAAPRHVHTAWRKNRILNIIFTPYSKLRSYRIPALMVSTYVRMLITHNACESTPHTLCQPRRWTVQRSARGSHTGCSRGQVSTLGMDIMCTRTGKPQEPRQNKGEVFLATVCGGRREGTDSNYKCRHRQALHRLQTRVIEKYSCRPLP